MPVTAQPEQRRPEGPATPVTSDGRLGCRMFALGRRALEPLCTGPAGPGRRGGALRVRQSGLDSGGCRCVPSPGASGSRLTRSGGSVLPPRPGATQLEVRVAKPPELRVLFRLRSSAPPLYLTTSGMSPQFPGCRIFLCGDYSRLRSSAPPLPPPPLPFHLPAPLPVPLPRPVLRLAGCAPLKPQCVSYPPPLPPPHTHLQEPRYAFPRLAWANRKAEPEGRHTHWLH